MSSSNHYNPDREIHPVDTGGGYPEFIATSFTPDERTIIWERIYHAGNFAHLVAVQLRTAALSIHTPRDARHRYCKGLISLISEYHNTIGLLTSGLQFGAASTLLRPAWECLCRAIWMVKYATSDQVEAWKRNQGAGHSAIMTLLKKDSEYGQLFWDFDLNNKHAFNDFTHGGFLSVVRRGYLGFYYNVDEILLIIDQALLILQHSILLYSRVFLVAEGWREVELIFESCPIDVSSFGPSTGAGGKPSR